MSRLSSTAASHLGQYAGRLHRLRPGKQEVQIRLPGTIGVSATFTKNNNVPELTTQAYWTAALTALGSTTPGTVPASLGAVVTGTINSAQLALDPIVVAANATTQDLSAVAASAHNPAFEAGVVQSFRNASGQWLGFYNVPTAIDFVYLAAATPAVLPGTALYNQF